MKTLKTFFVLLAMVITSSGYAQTKEETIEWLNRNGKDFLSAYCYWDGKKETSVHYYIELINKDTLRIRYYESTGYESDFDVLYSSIFYQDVNTVPIRDVKHCSPVKVFIVKALHKKKEATGETMEEFDLKIHYDKNNEENAKRALKAIMHLAKLSGAKENKQTF